MKKDFSLSIIISLLGLVILAHSCKAPHMEVENRESIEIPMQDFEPPEFCPEDFEERLGALLEMHGFLFNDAMFAVIFNLPDEIIDNGKTNLFNSTYEIAMLFSTVYDPAVAARIQVLLDQDIGLFFNYIDAIKSGNKELAKKRLVQSYANGQMFVQFLNIMNPYFAYEPEKHMLDEHVTLLADQVNAYLRRDLIRAEELNNRSAKQLKELALHITKAIQKQYEPSRFPQTFCDDWLDDSYEYYR